jgi:hypothetical protein
VISARSSNPFKFFLVLLSGVANLAFVSPAQAQDPNYAPPPMFDDMTPPMVRPQGQDGYLVSPKASPNTQLPEPTPQRPPIVTPRVSVDPDSQRPAVVPSAPVKSPPPVAPVKPAAPVVPVIAPAPKAPEMMKPIVEETYIKREKPAESKDTKKKSGEEPRTETVGKPKATPSPAKPAAPVKPQSDDKAPPPSSAEAPVIEPVKRNPSQSAIQGPKTMPALPAGNVDQQVIFDDAPETPETIMERHSREVQDKKVETLTPIVPAPNPNVTPATFESSEQGVLKKIIPYQPGQISLPEADADPIVAGIVKQLDGDEKENWRIQIRAFATPHGTGLSSDRRIALSRALSLRSTMITQGVPASSIDVTAEGLQTTAGGPPDRVDVYLYGPKGE